VFNLTVTRTGLNLASNIVVNYAVTGGTATQNLRYVLADGALTFAAGQASLPIPVQIINDLDPEGNQTVIVKLSSSTATIGPIGTTTLTILDDEQAITFSSPAYAVTEGIPSIAIPILRSGPTPGGVTVICQAGPSGSAIPDFDYKTVNTTLTFAAGVRSVPCNVPILNDTLVDGPRTVDLALSVPPGGSALPGAITAATLTINDNDQGGTIKFRALTYTVGEGAVGNLSVIRTGVNLASGVTVDYAVTGGTATNGTDYNLANGTLTFNAGQTSAIIPVPTFSDLVFDGKQTVIVTLSNPTSGASIGAPSSATLTIINKTRAQVRFLNNLLICAPECQAFTGRLTAEEGFTWLSSSGTPSPYQNVTSPTLSNFVGEAVEFPGATLFFPGSFSLTPNRKYMLLVTLDPANNPVLFLFDEGPVPGSVATSELQPRAQLTTSSTTSGIRYAPLAETLSPTH
jgi:hypothetical protein